MHVDAKTHTVQMYCTADVVKSDHSSDLLSAIFKVVWVEYEGHSLIASGKLFQELLPFTDRFVQMWCTCVVPHSPLWW